jgi:hypothetical protein
MNLRPPVITTLSAVHLTFMVGVAFYLCAFHNAGEQAVWTILCAGIVAELMPRRLRQYLVAELLLAISGCICYWWLVPHQNHDAVHAAVGMGFTYLLLVPSGLRRLRYLLSLVILELVLLGQQDHAHGFGIHELSALPFGIAALAVDGWLVGAVTARSASRLRHQWGMSLLRWALLPALTAIVIGMGIGGAVVRQAVLSKQDQVRITRTGMPITGGTVNGLDAAIHIGDHPSVQRDPVITARLSWTDGPAPTGLVYLRAAVLSNLHLAGNSLSWSMPSGKGLAPAPPPSRTPKRWAWVLRLPGGGDVVMRPDGGDSVDLDGLMTDTDGNLFRVLLGEAPRAYRADFDDGQLAADPASAALYREVPHELDDLPWATIEQAHWREVSPERAADLVCQTLRERCQYALDDLPQPAPGLGGVLRTFLFGEVSERRGHCQYFATSAALLLRRAGFQARCVAGFASDELGEQMVIFRALHAHAWVEIVNSKGSWQRVEATPPGSLPQRSAGVEVPELDGAKELPSGEKLPPAALDAIGKKRADEHRYVAACAVVVILLGVWLWRRAVRRGDPRLAALQRQSDSLLRLAASLGVPMGPATTLSQVAEALQARTGIDLTRILDQHLRARFGDGAPPDAWPLNELRAAARARAATPPRSGRDDPARGGSSREGASR